MTARSLYKKMVRTKYVGQCACGDGARWSERVRSNKSANKALRKKSI